MAKKSLKENFRYHFDNLMSKGTLSLIGFLATISLVIIIVFSILLWLVNLIPGKSFIDLFWLNIFKVLNTGTLDGNQYGQLNFILSFIIALCSIFIISLLIGLLTAGIQQKIWNLRKGRSKVIEKNHTVILGWSEIIFTIVKSLIEANRNQKKCRIVIMGNKDKVEMEDTIRERIKVPKNTKIICRQGNPFNLNDLKILNIFESKSIIILENSDSNVLKTLLAINSSRTDVPGNPVKAVAMLNEKSNLDSGRIAGEGFVNFILNRDFISRLIAHTCHQPGLSLIYHDLLSFRGSEIYTSKIPALCNKSLREAVFMFEDSSIIGIHSSGSVKLNPAASTIIKENDSVIALSTDDNTIVVSGINNYSINENAILPIEKDEAGIEKILILGYSQRAGIVIKELRKYISAQSEITLLANVKYQQELENLKKFNINILYGDLADYTFLSKLLNDNYNHIVVLAYQDLGTQDADSITLMALIHLRDIAKKKNLGFSLTSELLDINNRELAKAARVNDFIVSDNITSLLVSQISENAILSPVFEDLLSSKGSEIYLKKVKNYVDINEKVNFYTIVESALRKNELAIGYKLTAEADFVDKNFGIYINPVKSEYISFCQDDELIVLAEK